MNNFDDKEFLSRNEELISTNLKRKIANTKLLLVGVGLGSQIAILAARTGFSKFILCDGDKVELNNLNRQAFNINDIGKNKARVTKLKLLSINPHCEVEVYPKFLKDKVVAKKLIDKSDIVINMADPDKIIYSINDEAQRIGKPVFFPINFIFGGYVLIFLPNSPTLKNVVGQISKESFYTKLITNTLKFKPELLKHKQFFDMQSKYAGIIKQKKPIPQCGISANITSSLVIKEIVKYLNGSTQDTAPKPIVLNPWL